MRLSAALSLLVLAAALNSCTLLHRHSAPPEAAPAQAQPAVVPPTETKPEKPGFFTRLFSSKVKPTEQTPEAAALTDKTTETALTNKSTADTLVTKTTDTQPVKTEGKAQRPGFFTRLFSSKAKPTEQAPEAAALTDRTTETELTNKSTADTLVTKTTDTQLVKTEGKTKRPGFFARLFGAKEEQPAETQPQPVEEKTEVKPTAEQQAAAQAMLREQAQETAAPATEEATTEGAPAEISTGGLRLRRFAPPEEAASAQEGTSDPLPNAVELHGLRSPGLRGGNLPMDINGKLTPTNQTEEGN